MLKENAWREQRKRIDKRTYTRKRKENSDGVRRKTDRRRRDIEKERELQKEIGECKVGKQASYSTFDLFMQKSHPGIVKRKRVSMNAQTDRETKGGERRTGGQKNGSE